MPSKRSIVVMSVVAGLLSIAMATSAFAYAPGTATPKRPVYSAAKGGWKFSCSYAHWRSKAKVTWRCDLVERSVNDLGFVEEGLVQNHTGSWTPGSPSRRTPRYFKPRNVGEAQFCVKAWAYSVDGGSKTKYACN